MNSQTTPITVYLENPHTHVYVAPPSPSQFLPPSPTSSTSQSRTTGLWKEFALAVLCIVCGIILFMLLMNSGYWYWGVISGIAGFVVIRSAYGCYYSEKSVVPPPAEKPYTPPPSAPQYEEDPTPVY